MSKDKVHLARFVLDALDGEIVDSTADGAQTPLISSVLLPDSQTRCKFIELLLHRGASVNHQDGNGRTALSYACEKGYLDAVKILVQNGADPEILDSWGNTPLIYAAVADHTLVVEFLVRAFKRLGLRIDRQNKAGNSAVEVAKFLGHTECISALTNISKRSREADEGKFEGKVDCLASKLEVLKMSGRAEMSHSCTLQSVPQIKGGREGELSAFPSRHASFQLNLQLLSQRWSLQHCRSSCHRCLAGDKFLTFNEGGSLFVADDM
uniref:Uncharacterized protein n=1 Tax=Xiphophorus maculatus TaxID=8083 RepID=A0A3B5R451_XIPMA